MKLQNLLPQQWAAMTPYQRFESVAAIAMMLLVTLVIVVAVIRMASDVISGLVLGVLNPLDNKVFQGVFGDIVTLLIALEFNHSLQYAVKGKRSIVQTKLILLIALLAVSRKFIVMDIEATTAGTMLGLAAITLALGMVYWLLREYEDGLHLIQAAPHSERKTPDEEQ